MAALAVCLASAAFSQEANPTFDPYNPPVLKKLIPLPPALAPAGSIQTIYKQPALLSQIVADFTVKNPKATLDQVVRYANEMIPKHGVVFVVKTWIPKLPVFFYRRGPEIVQIGQPYISKCGVEELSFAVSKSGKKSIVAVTRQGVQPGSIEGILRPTRVVVKRGEISKEFALLVDGEISGYKADLSEVYQILGLEPAAKAWWAAVGYKATGSVFREPVLAIAIDTEGNLRFETNLNAYKVLSVKPKPDQDTNPSRPGMWIDPSGVELWYYGTCNMT